jgi:hypothetical protein
MPCVYELYGICFVTPTGTASLFPFKDFISALALLVIIYTISDVRYHFRVAVAPVALYPITFSLIVVIGFGTLVTDIWISEKWAVPNLFITLAMWQGMFGALFLGLILTWMFYAFMRPPIFGRRNYKKYSQALYRVILKGSDAELPIIAHELAASAEALVGYATRLDKSKHVEKKPSPEGYANDMLLLIANKKFCRHLVAASPMTAIRFLDAAAELQRRLTQIGPFAKNISTEAIRNTDSSLYHESDWFESGLLGHIKPFSKALYGNFELVEALQHNSPLDTDYQERDAWNARQVETYCRAVLMTFQSYLDGEHWGQPCYTLNGAIHDIQEIASSAISELKKRPEDSVGDAWGRLRAGVHFLTKMVSLIEKRNPVPNARTLRIRGQGQFANEDMYDRIAEAMFEIIHSAAYIVGPDEAWSVHYVSVWGDFFDRLNDKSKAMEIVQFKLRRLLFDEIMRFEKFPNYKSARLLGICLNVMGLKPQKRAAYGRQHAALKAVLLPWVQKNYKKIRTNNYQIGDACLIGGISYDEKGSRLVKTYSAGLKPEPDREYLAV